MPSRSKHGSSHTRGQGPIDSSQAPPSSTAWDHFSGRMSVLPSQHQTSYSSGTGTCKSLSVPRSSSTSWVLGGRLRRRASRASSCCKKPGFGCAMGRARLTASRASSSVRPRCISHAATRLAERDRPALQWTSTRPWLPRAASMKSLQAPQCCEMSASSASSRGKSRYSMPAHLAYSAPLALTTCVTPAASPPGSARACAAARQPSATPSRPVSRRRWMRSLPMRMVALMGGRAEVGQGARHRAREQKAGKRANEQRP
mmetsp:Transcript_115911/g.322753  ORF Transcript_115911/g.322753 Transcript_115911/m.322753 type:complete len:258 (+) Transcript_115911:339-1112(+)